MTDSQQEIAFYDHIQKCDCWRFQCCNPILLNASKVEAFIGFTMTLSTKIVFVENLRSSKNNQFGKEITLTENVTIRSRNFLKIKHNEGPFKCYPQNNTIGIMIRDDSCDKFSWNWQIRADRLFVKTQTPSQTSE